MPRGRSPRRNTKYMIFFENRHGQSRMSIGHVQNGKWAVCYARSGASIIRRASMADHTGKSPLDDDGCPLDATNAKDIQIYTENRSDLYGIILTPETIDRIKRFINDELHDRKLDRWLFDNFRTAHLHAGLSMQTLSDHLAYLRGLPDNESVCIAGYCEGSGRFNHSHRPDFYQTFDETKYKYEIRGHNVRRLNQIIMAAPSIDTNATVYRISPVDNYDFYWFCDNVGARVQPWPDQLVSTSFRGFLSNFTGIHFIISLPVGACGLTLLDPDMIFYLDDHEFLLPVGTEFDVTGCEMSESNQPVVRLSLVGPVKPPTPSDTVPTMPSAPRPLTILDLRNFVDWSFPNQWPV